MSNLLEEYFNHHRLPNAVDPVDHEGDITRLALAKSLNEQARDEVQNQGQILRSNYFNTLLRYIIVHCRNQHQPIALDSPENTKKLANHVLKLHLGLFTDWPLSIGTTQRWQQQRTVLETLVQRLLPAQRGIFLKIDQNNQTSPRCFAAMESMLEGNPHMYIGILFTINDFFFYQEEFIKYTN